ALGMTVADVKYIKGNPTYVLGNAIPSKNDKFAGFRDIIYLKDLEEGKNITDYDSWTYTYYDPYILDRSKGEPWERYQEAETHHIDIEFNKDKRVASISCVSRKKWKCPNL